MESSIDDLLAKRVERFSLNRLVLLAELPGLNVRIRKMIVDAGGKLWYMGSHSGRLGVVE